MNARSRFQFLFAATPTHWSAPWIAFAAVLLGQVAAGAEVVFGSFVQREAAEELHDRVESDFAVDARVVGIEIGGVWYLRVTAEADDARALIARARRSGYPDAWLLADPLVRQPQPEEPGPTVPVDESPTAPEAAAVPLPADESPTAPEAAPVPKPIDESPTAPEAAPVPKPIDESATAPEAAAVPLSVDESPTASEAATVPVPVDESRTAPEAAAAPAPVETRDPTTPDTAGETPVNASRTPVARTLRFAISPDAKETIPVPSYDGVDIQVDGRLDEAVWVGVSGYDDMVLVEPGTLANARFRTVARYLHTADGIYIGVWNEQPRRTLAAMRRSTPSTAGTDAWGITLDTSGGGRHGHWFNIALGARTNEPGARRSTNGFSEPTWRYATAALRDGWSLEAFIPWTALALPAMLENRVMGIYVNRNVAHLGERWGWPVALTPSR